MSLVTICIFINSIRQRFNYTKSDYSLRFVDEVPDEVDLQTIYFIGTPAKQQYAIMNCPCCCGRAVELNLNPKSLPCWKVQWHWSGTISLSPSIWRKNGCRSHFFLKRNKIIWCKL